MAYPCLRTVAADRGSSPSPCLITARQPYLAYEEADRDYRAAMAGHLRDFEELRELQAEVTKRKDAYEWAKLGMVQP